VDGWKNDGQSDGWGDGWGEGWELEPWPFGLVHRVCNTRSGKVATHLMCHCPEEAVAVGLHLHDVQAYAEREGEGQNAGPETQTQMWVFMLAFRLACVVLREGGAG